MSDKQDSPKRKPCQHAEEVCQRCLEKVQTKTTEYPYPEFCQHCYGDKEEDSPPPKRVVTPEKPKARQNPSFGDIYFLVIQLGMTYFAAKNFLKAFTQ